MADSLMIIGCLREVFASRVRCFRKRGYFGQGSRVISKKEEFSLPGTVKGSP
jgi:hypothetical protein